MGPRVPIITVGAMIKVFWDPRGPHKSARWLRRQAGSITSILQLPFCVIFTEQTDHIHVFIPNDQIERYSDFFSGSKKR